MAANNVFNKCLDFYVRWSGLYLRLICIPLVIGTGLCVGGSLAFVFIHEDNEPILVPSIVMLTLLQFISLIVLLEPRHSVVPGLWIIIFTVTVAGHWVVLWNQEKFRDDPYTIYSDLKPVYVWATAIYAAVIMLPLCALIRETFCGGRDVRDSSRAEARRMNSFVVVSDVNLNKWEKERYTTTKEGGDSGGKSKTLPFHDDENLINPR